MTNHSAAPAAPHSADALKQTELLPCPFCGRPAGELMGFVGCEPCALVRRDAASWNRRPTPADCESKMGEWSACQLRTIELYNMIHNRRPLNAERINTTPASPDLVELRAKAEAAGSEAWNDEADADGYVFGSDGDSVCICHANMGHMPEPIYPEHRAAFIAAANPAAILALLDRLERAEADAKHYSMGADAEAKSADEWRERALRAEAAAGAVPEVLRRTGELLRTQDNRITDQPMFIVQQKRRITGLDTDYCDNIMWLATEDDYSEASAEEAARLEAEYQESLKVPQGWMRTGYHDYWEFVTACFTEQGCKDYLARDGHNLKEPRIYAEGSYRNEEYRTVRNWLLSLAAAPPAQETNPTTQEIRAVATPPAAAPSEAKPFAAPGKWFPTGVLGHPMREYEPGKWESANWPSEAHLFAAAPSEPVACTHGQAYGIIDPDYARYYSIIRCTAWQYGYAIGMHGSFTRDLDLIAVPWADNACAPDRLVKVICGRTDLTEHHKNPTEKPHGRLVFTLMLPGFGDPRWVDLSIVPIATPPAQDAGTGVLAQIRAAVAKMAQGYEYGAGYYNQEIFINGLREAFDLCDITIKEDWES